VRGTEVILNAMLRHGVNKILFTSSSSVYGANDNKSFRESAPLHPLSPYANSKVQAEEVIRNFQEKHNLSALILRLFNVYGPRIRPDLLISRLHRSAIDQSVIHLYNYGRNQKDFTHISDVMAGMYAAIDRLLGAEPSIETYNLGTGHAVTVLEVMHTMENLLGRNIPAALTESLVGDVGYTCADIEAAKHDLSYVPVFAIREGLNDTIAYLNKYHE
jgi:nucleoside-diphosphate-sugar epimerase